jgi:hypothetical protein
VRTSFTVNNLAGATIPVEVALQVTTEAIRRGSNVDYYIQREFCGVCGSDTLEEDAKRFYATGELEPLGLSAGTMPGWEELPH